MSTTALFDLPAPTPRYGQPVRRQSRLAGREGTFWQATTRQDGRKMLLAAKRYELAAREAGSRNGPLGHVALEILEFMINLVDFRTGRLDPSLDYLMGKLKRSRDAIVRALANLRTHGFLDWLRRYVPTGNEGAGPRVQQTSNAYRLSLPARAVRLLGRLLQPSPLPDDVEQAMDLRKAELAAHRASLTLAELPLFEIENPTLAASLSRLGKCLMERESAKQSEPMAKFNSMKK
jgi:hypothetical protein